MGFSAFLVTIQAHDVKVVRSCGGMTGKFVAYVIKVVNGDRTWNLEKRYSQFEDLDAVMRSKFWYMSVPKLPTKKMFFNFDNEFVGKRQKELEIYLRDMLQVACFSQSDEMWQFLTDSRSVVGSGPPELEEENKRHAEVGGVRGSSYEDMGQEEEP
mmetsp:Transcript_13954/g.20314  ORF Transcript_13954/g.20314 Transcript_13954/m.20314 type:complete len:156 (-) Transcript_13954:81-548(-)